MVLIKLLLFTSAITLALCSVPNNAVDIHNDLESSSIASPSNGTDVNVFVISDRIFGGTDTDIENIPWQVSLQQKGVHVCGGAIIAPKWILTAAHCTPKSIASKFSVRVGSTNKRRGGKIVKIRRFFQHSRFRRRTLDYDFTLIQLVEPLNYTELIQPVRLPSASTQVADRKLCLISGWGGTENPGELPDILRSVSVPIVNQAYCDSKYTTGVTDRMICAGYRNGGKDTCFGDSGGPMTCEIDGNDILIGIVSFGEECGMPDSPGVYSRVSSVRQWIAVLTGV